MINLPNLKLEDLIPSSIKNDSEIIAISRALDKQMQEVTNLIIETVIIPRIDELNEDMIDILAWQFHVDFYEPLGLSLDKKRQLVKNSIKCHQRKGTKSVLEEIINLLFFDKFKIYEWFEYNGEPYFFKIESTNHIINQSFFEELIRAIYAVKNTRSWLELIKIIRKFKFELKIGSMPTDKTTTFVKYVNPKDQLSSYELIINDMSTDKTTDFVKYTNPKSKLSSFSLKLNDMTKVKSKVSIKYTNPNNVVHTDNNKFISISAKSTFEQVESLDYRNVKSNLYNLISAFPIYITKNITEVN